MQLSQSVLGSSRSHAAVRRQRRRTVSVLVEIGHATSAARQALRAVTRYKHDREWQVHQLAELTMIAMKARHWKEDGFTLPASLDMIARRFA